MNMKYLIFAILFCVNWQAFGLKEKPLKKYVIIAEAYKTKKKMQDSLNICQSSNNVPQNLIDDAQEGHLTDSKSLSKYYICYGQNIKFLCEFELCNLNLAKLENWLKNSLKHHPETVDNAIEKCKIDGEENEAKIFQFIICLAEKGAPVDVVGAGFTEKVREEISNNHFVCKNQHSSINQSILTKARKGRFLDTVGLQTQYFCFGLYVRYLDISKGMQFNILRDWLKNFLKYESTVVDEALGKCYKHEKNVDMESNFQMVKCLNEEGVSIDNLKEDKQNVQVENEIETTISDTEDICAETVNIDTYAIDKAREGSFEDSNKLKTFYLCYSTRIGYLRVYGEFKLEDWLKKSLKYDENIVDKAMKTCRNDETDIIEQNYQAVKCLSNEGVPVDVPSP